MLNAKFGEKEYHITFGYEATLKSRLLSKMARQSVVLEQENGDLEKIEDMLLFIPEVVLVGLQKEHKEEFGYDLDNNNGYDEQKAKVLSMVADAFDRGEIEVFSFFNDLQEELVTNGFLKKMFEREVEAEKKKTKK